MVHKMSGQFGNLRPRKRKISSEVKSSRKVSTTRRRCTKSPKMPSEAESSAAVSGYNDADDPLERLSHISCECQQHSGRRRCSASPELDRQEGKENELRMWLELDGCRMNGALDKHESEDMECEETDKNIFPDDDSNQILPVEQFFGNLDALQDFPQRSSSTSAHVRRESRRRHFYAPEDSDEEDAGFDSMQRDDTRGTR